MKVESSGQHLEGVTVFRRVEVGIEEIEMKELSEGKVEK
jgi:hypothetical protein